MNFNTMLDDIYNQLGNTVYDTIVLPNPIIKKDTTSITWTNVKEFLKITNTDPDHFFDFIKININQPMNWKSDSKSDGIIIHNKKILALSINNIMKKYINEYIICNICKRSTTMMIKDSEIKKWKIKCSSCNSEYTV